jgi:dTDP-4-dehydrorhamnose reductase
MNTTDTAAKRVLILGANGQLARTLARTAPSGTQCIGLPRAEVDITDAEALARALDREQPDWVINGAAYNLVDRAAGEGKSEAFRVNTLAVGGIARACAKAGVPLVHFSTDLVFDGAQHVPYTENCSTRPLSIYGITKLAGEHFALAASSRNLVVRVCRLFGPTPSGRIAAKPVGNFPLLMLHLAQTRGQVRVVDDQIGAPSYLPDVALGVWELANSGQGGLFHLSNSGETTFAALAQETFRLADVRCVVEAVSSESYGAAAKRPLYSTLDNAKAWAAGVTPLRPWQEALAELIAAILPPGASFG